MSIANLTTGFHFNRSRQISGILVRHGLDYLVGSLGLNGFAAAQKLFPRPRQERLLTKPEHVRMALEEMGTTFIKLGQILSTRADLLPPDYLTELAKLQDAAPPVPSKIAEEAIVAELGRPIETVFASFDSEPLAAASIGQAHAATLPDGTEVIVKVRRPGVVEQVEEDLAILNELAVAAARHWEFADRYDLVGLAQEFAETLRSELDYIREGQSAELFAANFAHDPQIHIPRVFWETTTSKVLTLERIRGIKINNLAGLDAQGIDRPALAEYATNVVLKMVCDDGFFHADPHPGNFFIEPAGHIGLIDFGMVGRVDERTRERLADLLIAISNQDAERLVDVFLDLGVTRKRLNRELLRREIEHLLSVYWGRPLKDLKVGPLLNDVFAVMRRHHLHLPSNLALLLKTVIMIEGLGANLDPDFHLTTVLAPYSQQLMIQQYSPFRWFPRLGRASVEWARLGVEMPRQLRRMMRAAERGNFQVGMRPEGFDPLINRFEQISNRIVLGVIAAAFINGLAVLVSVYRPPAWEKWAWVVFAFGFLCALLLGVYLAWTILRTKHG
jgi:ubiquinone biosynthesis protein